MRRMGALHGARNLLRVDAVRELACSPRVREVMEALLGPACFAVRGLYFDKPLGANWMVPWHQDLHIAVKTRADLPGFAAWSVKAGVPHVEPPFDLLERMATIRIHLDAAHAGNGALRVIAGSHRLGRLSADDVDAARLRDPETLCEVPAGGALLMRPALLHASSNAGGGRARRVVHLEFAAEDLPAGLEWADRV